MARDDAHGYGQASRFLTEAVQGLFTVTHACETRVPAGISMAPERRIEVSVDALFA